MEKNQGFPRYTMGGPSLVNTPHKPACHPEELKRWIHFVWREMRQQNTTVPDDVLDFIKEVSLNAVEK